MNDADLDAMLSSPLPERDAGDFSVTMMENITRHQARGARILSWIMASILVLVIAAAGVFGAMTSAAFGAQPFVVPAVLMFLALLLSYTVMQTMRE